jgi:hypothetical protein
MSTAEVAIPYEKQFDPQASRTCGAACLSMVYRSFGKDVSQRLIWPEIAKRNRFGSLASTTHLMAHDAIARGFAAVAIQARDPLKALRICRDAGIRVILNHRVKSDSSTGHYTVLADLDETHVTLHDPLLGPSRRLSHEELLALWQPSTADSEIAGNFLIGIADHPRAIPSCVVCQKPMLSLVECPNCKSPVSLNPAALVGCMNDSCAARLWNYVCCSSCDFTWNFTVPAQQAGVPVAIPSAGSPAPGVPLSSAPSSLPARAVTSSRNDPANLNVVFAEIDKFCNHILSLPVAANHPEIRQHLDFIAGSKDKLSVAMAEEVAKRKAHEANLAALAQAAKENEVAHRKKVEELNKPAPPLDGDALAKALLKNLGLTN